MRLHVAHLRPATCLIGPQDDGNTWLPVYKTEARRKCLSPIWSEIHVRAVQLNNGDLQRPLRLQVGPPPLLSDCLIARMPECHAEHRG
jgi:hypothetical protein